MKTLVWGVWSAMVWPVAIVWMGLIVAVSLPLTLFVPFSRIQARFPATMMGWVPHFAFARYRIRYDPSFDPTPGSIFVMNHTSMFDGHVSLRVVPHAFCGVQNASHFKVPFYGWLMREAGGIPMVPGQPNQSVHLVREAKERFGRGYSLLVFPEGHRTRDGKLREFKRGSFVLAQATGAPIVPLAVRGLRQIFPRGTWIMRPGIIDVYVGAQVPTAELRPEDVEDLAARVREGIRGYIEDGADRITVAPRRPPQQTHPTSPTVSR